MPTTFTHAAVGLGIAALISPTQPALFWTISAGMAALPDLDVIGFALGVRYGAFFGHRGFSHSICCAVLMACLAATALSHWLDLSWWLLWGYFSIVMASHGLLDACNDAGLGIAFFSPFDTTRYFLPWRPLVTPYIGLDGLRYCFGRVFWSEVRWVWLPLAALVGLAILIRSATGRVL